MCDKELQSKKDVLMRLLNIVLLLYILFFVFSFVFLIFLKLKIIFAILLLLAFVMAFTIILLGIKIDSINSKITYNKAYQKSKNILKEEIRVRCIISSDETFENQILNFIQHAEGIELTAKFENKKIILTMESNGQNKQIEIENYMYFFKHFEVVE